MANCTYLTELDGNAIIYPETSPDSARCQICLLMILISRQTYSVKKEIDKKCIEAKLPR